MEYMFAASPWLLRPYALLAYLLIFCFSHRQGSGVHILSMDSDTSSTNVLVCSLFVLMGTYALLASSVMFCFFRVLAHLQVNSSVLECQECCFRRIARAAFTFIEY